jgi:hypothetical protein
MFTGIALLLLLLRLALLSMPLETLFSIEELLEMGVSLEPLCISDEHTEGQPGDLRPGRLRALRLTGS